MRVARDTMDQKRLKIIETLYSLEVARLSGSIAREADLHPQTTTNELVKMKALKMVTESIVGEYVLTEECYNQYKVVQLVWVKGIFKIIKEEQPYPPYPNQWNELRFQYLIIPPDTLCEKCGIRPVEYQIKTSDRTLKRCESCFKEMRMEFPKIKFERSER